MKMPPDLKPWLTPAQWRGLALHELDPDDRKCVLHILIGAFEGTDPKDITKKDLADVLRMTRTLADDFRECGDEETRVSKNDAIAAEATAREVLRDLRARRKSKLKRRKP